jgi:hypothetical protein
MRFAISALLVGALPGLALAQQRRGPDLDDTMAELTEKLELDEGQATQIRELLLVQNEESRRMMEEARASGQGRSAFGAMRERMQEMRQATDTKIKALLTETQAARYEEILAERAAARRSRRSQEGPPGARRGT